MIDQVRNPPATPSKKPSLEDAAAAVRTLIAYIGDDPSRAALIETPRRVVAALEDLYCGYRKAPVDSLSNALAETASYDDLVLIRDIDFVSHCEHHMMPFYGKIQLAYWPARKIVGLSKLPRLVEVYARRLQTQERLTSEIGNAISELLEPRGVAVIINAVHTCITLRGVMKPNVSTVTTLLLGVARDSLEEQRRFMNLIGIT